MAGKERDREGHDAGSRTGGQAGGEAEEGVLEAAAGGIPSGVNLDEAWASRRR
jgi:hypothetical protein